MEILRNRRDVVPVTASARWRGGSRRSPYPDSLVDVPTGGGREGVGQKRRVQEGRGAAPRPLNDGAWVSHSSISTPSTRRRVDGLALMLGSLTPRFSAPDSEEVDAPFAHPRARALPPRRPPSRPRRPRPRKKLKPQKLRKKRRSPRRPRRSAPASLNHRGDCTVFPPRRSRAGGLYATSRRQRQRD